MSGRVLWTKHERVLLRSQVENRTFDFSDAELARSTLIALLDALDVVAGAIEGAGRELATAQKAVNS